MGNGKSQPVYLSAGRGRSGEANRRGRAPTTFAHRSPTGAAQVRLRSLTESAIDSASSASSTAGEQGSPESQRSDLSSSYGGSDPDPALLQPLPQSVLSTSNLASAFSSPTRQSQASSPANRGRGASPLSQIVLSTSNLASGISSPARQLQATSPATRERGPILSTCDLVDASRRAQAPTSTQERTTHQRRDSSPIAGARTAIPIPRRALPTTWDWETAHTDSTTTPAGSTPERSTYPLSASSPIATGERLKRGATLAQQALLHTSSQDAARRASTPTSERRTSEQRTSERSTYPPTASSTTATAERLEPGAAIPPRSILHPSSQYAARMAHSRATELERQLGSSPVSLPIAITRGTRTRTRVESPGRSSHTPYNTPESR
jgi:hypothetical protein